MTRAFFVSGDVVYCVRLTALCTEATSSGPWSDEFLSIGRWRLGSSSLVSTVWGASTGFVVCETGRTHKAKISGLLQADVE